MRCVILIGLIVSTVAAKVQGSQTAAPNTPAQLDFSSTSIFQQTLPNPTGFKSCASFRLLRYDEEDIRNDARAFYHSYLVDSSLSLEFWTLDQHTRHWISQLATFVQDLLALDTPDQAKGCTGPVSIGGSSYKMLDTYEKHKYEPYGFTSDTLRVEALRFPECAPSLTRIHTALRSYATLQHTPHAVATQAWLSDGESKPRRLEVKISWTGDPGFTKGKQQLVERLWRMVDDARSLLNQFDRLCEHAEVTLSNVETSILLSKQASSNLSTILDLDWEVWSDNRNALSSYLKSMVHPPPLAVYKLPTRSQGPWLWFW